MPVFLHSVQEGEAGDLLPHLDQENQPKGEGEKRGQEGLLVHVGVFLCCFVFRFFFNECRL